MGSDAEGVDTDNPVAVVAAIGVLEHELALLDPLLWRARAQREAAATAFRLGRAQAWLTAREGGEGTQADVQARVDLAVGGLLATDGQAQMELSQLLDRQRSLERRLSALQSVLRTHSQVSA